MSTELSDYVVQTLKENTAACYSRVLHEIGKLPGFVVDQEGMHKMTANANRAVTRNLADRWPVVLFGSYVNLLTYKGQPVTIGFITYNEVSFSLNEVILFTDSYNRVKRNNYRSRDGSWNVSWMDKQHLLGGNVPKLRDMQGLGLNVWETGKRFKLSWRLDVADGAAGFAKRFDRLYLSREKCIKNNKTEEPLRKALYDRYIKEIWTPKQAWYNALTQEQQARV